MKWLMLLLLVLAGCRPPAVQIQRVEVPVPVPCPEPPVLSRPSSAIAALPPDATAPQQAKALVTDLGSWIDFALQEEAILNGYRRNPSR